jgi:hypothetical protein
VAVVYTPGGHRRFALEEVERLAQQHVETEEVAGHLPSTDVMRDAALSHTRHELAEQGEPPQWVTRMSDEEREEQRVMGRQLLGLMMQYVGLDDSDEAAPDRGEALLGEARSIGAVYARQAASAGLSLSEALQATMFFRDNLVESALLLPQGVRPDSDANRRLLRRINGFLNNVQLAIAETFRAEAKGGGE